MIAILHNIRSVHNVASMFRTSDGAGVEKLYLTGFTPTPLNRLGKLRQDFHKVSLGAEDTILWESVDNIFELTNKLQNSGFMVYAVEIHKKSIPYHDIGPNDGKYCFIFGNEVSGVPENLIEKCNGVVEIPMKGEKESLNVSVAFGVIAYYF